VPGGCSLVPKEPVCSFAHGSKARLAAAGTRATTASPALAIADLGHHCCSPSTITTSGLPVGVPHPRPFISLTFSAAAHQSSKRTASSFDPLGADCRRQGTMTRSGLQRRAVGRDRGCEAWMLQAGRPLIGRLAARAWPTMPRDVLSAVARKDACRPDRYGAPAERRSCSQLMRDVRLCRDDPQRYPPLRLLYLATSGCGGHEGCAKSGLWLPWLRGPAPGAKRPGGMHRATDLSLVAELRGLVARAGGRALADRGRRSVA
jgi:hypothetical protein